MDDSATSQFRPTKPGIFRVRLFVCADFIYVPVPDRLIKTAADRTAIEAGCWFDQQAADRVREFFATFIRHTIGEWAGKPFILFDWQWHGIIEPLFGWKRADGRRRFTCAYISVPKKNGKSTILAGISHWLLIADGEECAEVYSAGADKHQAGIIFREAKRMVDKSPALASLITANKKVLTGPGGATYQALSRESGTKEGLNASAILFDELHAQSGRELWDCLRYSGASRRQPLVLAITTAGGDLNTICGYQYEYACNIRDGHNAADIHFFQYIAEADKKDDWSDQNVWAKANPSLGETIKLDDFRGSFVEATENAVNENAFRRYRLNQWIQAAGKWLSMSEWDACKAGVTEESLWGRTGYGGLDLSAVDDTTALVLSFPNPDGSVDTLSYFFLPEDNIDALGRAHKVNYRAWQKAGHFILTPGNVVDYEIVAAEAARLASLFKIKEIAIDKKFNGQEVETDLINKGMVCVPASQTWIAQDLPAKELEKLLKSKQFRHSGHPVFRWHASNVVAERDKNDNISISKKKSRSKIDGIAALLMSLMSMMTHAGKAGEELYVNSNPRLEML